MEALASFLLPHLATTASQAVGSILPHPNSAPPQLTSAPAMAADHSPSTNDAREPAAVQSNDVVASRQHIQTSPSTLAIPMSNMAPIRLPFRLFIATEPVNTARGIRYTNYSVAASAGLSTIAANFRRARLTRLCFRVEPNYTAVAHPFTIDMCWVTANSAPADRNILTVPGARRITYTNVTSGNADNACVEAPLGAMNPMIKDSVAYVDTPYLKYSIVGLGNGDPERGEDFYVCDTYIEGEVEVSHAALHGTNNH